ncbi:MAG TPA: tripartite tricarboxylate transporter substrate binding protein [Burkholderiales bacterium]|nr:tripartite tricarboxylate transporter substrate binding protein [Burkholderiales bacterium]
MVRASFAVALAALAQVAFAQSGYPSRPITMVVGFAPGGGTDTVARIVAKKMADGIGQSVVVENKPGAGGNLATDHVAHAQPDGYTILLGSVGSLAVAPHIVAKLPYDPMRDLAPITMAVVFANVLVVNPSVPASTLAEFVKLAKDKPGAISYGSSGIGGAGHLAGELLKMMAEIDIVHVPYKGGGPAMQGMLGGQIQAIFATPVSSGSQIKAGKVRAIATTGVTRTKLLPDIPTVAESGYPGYEATNWYAYLAPAGTPKDVLARLHRELVQALSAPDVHEQFDHQGVEAKPGTPEELAKYMESELATWGRVVKAAKIQAN